MAIRFLLFAIVFTTTSFAAYPQAGKQGKKPKEEKPAASVEQLLKEVKTPPGFDATIFATPDQANYPVFVAAAPDGTLYVSSDGNGSLGRDPNRGRLLRLRDTKGTGRADEVKEFAKVDAPRGLVWDGDRLYVMHPPHLSVFIDKDGKGVADEQKIIVKNCGFNYKDRPADHTSNGVTLGVDGWLYLAIGDFGFMEAEGTDGRKLQLRGGGVIRVRPDGTGLELFARGTRNILEVALSPLLEGIVRDNTNDGDGWDVRLHHITGMEEHGYPSFYQNFASEEITPLNDYGNGAGCGACWIDEPGIPAKWNNKPFTADWGREMFFAHTLTPKGSTFGHTPQELFAKVPRATDLDVDASSRIYMGSWRGGQFTWAGPNIGFITRLTPTGYTPPPVPDFAKLDAKALVKLFESPSHRTRLEAQRSLLRRHLLESVRTSVEALAADKAKPLATRVLAIFALKQAFGEKSHDFLINLSNDASVSAWAIRALTDHEKHLANVPFKTIQNGLQSKDDRTRLEAVIAIGRLGNLEYANVLQPLLGDADPVVAHTAFRVMIRLNAHAACFAVLDSSGSSDLQRLNALRALQLMHLEPVVAGLIDRLAKETDEAKRHGMITALCRLRDVDGPWKGNSWGTRPDTRGPYFQPERWAGTDRIDATLKELLDKSTGAEAVFLAKAFGLHRIAPADGLAKLMEMAKGDKSILPDLVDLLAKAEKVPAEALPVLKQVAESKEPEATRAAALNAMTKLGSREAFVVVLSQIALLSGDQSQKVTARLFAAPLLESQYATFIAEAAKLSGESSVWADAVLLHLGNKKLRSNEARAAVPKAIEDGWQQPKRRAQLIRAAMLSKDTSRSLAIVEALTDTDYIVQAAARAAVKALRLDPKKVREESVNNGPRLGTLKVDAILDDVMKTKGSIDRGKLLFQQARCSSCHTVNQADPVNGPYLGNIATTYKRRELAESILLPNKTIAQGFATNQFLLVNGTVQTGFVVRESATVVTIRDSEAKEHEIKLADVEERKKLETSMMPEGLLNDFTLKDLASIVDYLESLAVGAVKK